MSDTKVFVFDLDGTLCTTQGMHYVTARPNMGAIRKVNRLYDQGHRIIIDTARGSVEGLDWTAVTEAQLKGWGVKYHELRCGEKPAADVYVDDRAVNARDWLSEGAT